MTNPTNGETPHGVPVDAADPSLYFIQTNAPGPEGSLPLDEELLLEEELLLSPELDDELLRPPELDELLVVVPGLSSGSEPQA